jgi:uncharacterized phage protein (predicted DNA packaging)
MKWLTVPLIKQHCRIDGDGEDELLAMYGESAEDTVLEVIQRSYTEVMERWGEVPKPLVHASLLLVSQSYEHREAVTSQSMYAVPYAFDMMVKPYMKLTSNNENTQGYGRHCNL